MGRGGEPNCVASLFGEGVEARGKCLKGCEGAGESMKPYSVPVLRRDSWQGPVTDEQSVGR